MRYIEEYHMGYDAGSGDEPSTANPHVWHSVAWWAWHAGWVAGAKDLERDRDNVEDFCKQMMENEDARTKDRS